MTRLTRAVVKKGARVYFKNQTPVESEKSYQLAVRWKRFISSKENVDGDQILQIGREFDSENARAATRSGRFPRTHVSRPIRIRRDDS